MKNDIIKFLLGEDSFDSVWFGEKHPTERGAFWWRKHLRQFNQASQQSEIVRQRLHYHFAKVGGGWNIEGMNAPFMKDFLNEVQKLVDLSMTTNILTNEKK